MSNPVDRRSIPVGSIFRRVRFDAAVRARVGHSGSAMPSAFDEASGFDAAAAPQGRFRSDQAAPDQPQGSADRSPTEHIRGMVGP